MKLSNDWIEFISGWRRNFAPDELPAFIKQLKCIRNNEIAQLEAKNARLKKELLAHKENEGDECPLCACEAKNDRLKRENERLLKGIMAHLHLLASRCECGEPLKETDAFNCLDTLLKEQEDD